MFCAFLFSNAHDPRTRIGCRSVCGSFMRVPLTPTRGLPRFRHLLLAARRAAPKRASISKGYRADLESYRLPRCENVQRHATRAILFFFFFFFFLMFHPHRSLLTSRRLKKVDGPFTRIPFREHICTDDFSKPETQVWASWLFNPMTHATQWMPLRASENGSRYRFSDLSDNKSWRVISFARSVRHYIDQTLRIELSRLSVLLSLYVFGLW